GSAASLRSASRRPGCGVCTWPPPGWPSSATASSCTRCWRSAPTPPATPTSPCAPGGAAECPRNPSISRSTEAIGVMSIQSHGLTIELSPASRCGRSLPLVDTACAELFGEQRQRDFFGVLAAHRLAAHGGGLGQHCLVIERSRWRRLLGI